MNLLSGNSVHIFIQKWRSSEDEIGTCIACPVDSLPVLSEDLFFKVYV